MAKRRQETDEQAAAELDELPDDADRALNIVRGKLDNSLSVQYTVNDLIAKATDPDNLAVIFSGSSFFLLPLFSMFDADTYSLLPQAGNRTTSRLLPSFPFSFPL